MEGFMDDHEACGLYMGVNILMYIAGIVFFLAILVYLRYFSGKAKVANGLAWFIYFYQFVFTIYGCVACWGNEDLTDDVDSVEGWHEFFEWYNPN